MSYKYTVFGLCIESDFECPLLIPSDGEPDVHMSYGEVAENLPGAASSHRFFDAKPGQLLFRVDDVARFLVTDGKEIVVDRVPGSDDNQMYLFLTGSAFGALIHQRGLLPFHASAVKTDAGVIIFTGQVGAGKSTLAGAFHSRGYQILTDDICVISEGADGPTVYPGYPELKITRATTDRLDMDTRNLERMTWRSKDKYLVSVRERFDPAPVSLHAVYWLTPSDVDEIEIIPVEGVEKFNILVTNTYWNQFLDGLGTGASHFRLATSVAQNALVRRVVRPTHGFMLDELVDQIEGDI
ncbi:MAG: hypothetical protein HOH43_09025 [Candidatus Latescibacteria bacterium]|jgi:hypothetical protein|nr:hypothetical protein [Candidatus Latescibacterota bacterium]